jgi:hypothetical protein
MKHREWFDAESDRHRGAAVGSLAFELDPRFLAANAMDFEAA